MTSGSFADRGPADAGVDWHAVRVVLHVVWLVIATVVVVVGTGLVLGGAVGYGLSWLVETMVGMLEF